LLEDHVPGSPLIIEKYDTANMSGFL
jgi:hypothetical protein